MVDTLDLNLVLRCMGSSPIMDKAPIAQLVEHLSDKQKVIGSIPIRSNLAEGSGV